MNEIEQIRERLAAATPGPWFQGRDSKHLENAKEVYSEREPSSTSEDICTAWYPTDAEFIAHAPTDMARLIAAVDAVTALAERWERTPALRRGTMARDIRTALTTALGGGA
ncbi:hypothetical protein [Pseudarthrobacter sp. S9]|uniref:hypothetical protein n=1 Tax=Pseudarthrobacter sp. S9 TaxID=3418421 RepID=UPI003D02FB26